MDDVQQTGIQQEGAAFPEAEQQTETATESSTEIKPTETTQSSDGGNSQDATKRPFHEDPAVQDYINRQVESRLNKSLQEKFAPQEQTGIPPWFGGDKAAWDAYQADQKRSLDAVRQSTIEEIKREKTEEEKRVKDATEHLNTSVAEIEKSAGKKLTESQRNKLLKLTYDKQLWDGQGRWNYALGWEFMQLEEKSKAAEAQDKIEARKDIAAISTSDSKETTDKPTSRVPSFFRRAKK